MLRPRSRKTPAEAFARVASIGLTLPDVEATTKYDGSPVLKLRGCFMAGLAMHPSAAPETLVVRASIEAREWLLEEAPETYYLTDYYRRYPLILVRLARIDHDALRDLLSTSWRLSAEKARHRSRAVLDPHVRPGHSQIFRREDNLVSDRIGGATGPARFG